MLSYEEELKKFQLVPETEEVEDLVLRQDLTDMTDLMKQMMEDRQNRREM